MADETNLVTYKLQLQQVEASLENDPDNEDLLKLKNDLQEVIELTLELVTTGASTSAEADVLPADEEEEAAVPEFDWKVGDECMATWSEDGGLYEAKIEEILEDGTCSVTFESYGNTDVTKLIHLKPVDPNRKRHAVGDGGPDAKKPVSKKDMIAQQKEYKKKKSQKKKQRQKQLEEEREQEKQKWQNFNSKVLTKTKKGFVKKSIFATPDTVEGRVGVGTCGVGGKPMTKFVTHEKWKK